MLEFFFGRQQSRRDWKRADDDWSRDPLAHPAIAAMSARELADLPLVPPPSETIKRSAGRTRGLAKPWAETELSGDQLANRPASAP